MRVQHVRILLMCAAALTVTACGGGGERVASIGSTPPPAPPPPPPPPPPPTGSSAVDIFQNPVTQEFATIGIGSPLRIRYDAPSNRYEVMAGTRGWEALVDDDNSVPGPGSANMNFDFAGSPQSFFMIRVHYSFADPQFRYLYSNLAAWGVPDPNGQSGITAFGIATPAGSVPVTGSASYQGLIEGVSTVTCPCGWDGETVATWVGGSVQLNFDFASGSLGGELRPYLEADKRYDLGTLAFENTVFGVGSQTFSGSFATSVSGPNSFSGLLTGPNAEELIGKWAFPFLSPIDGAPHSAQGAWIAKRP